MNIVEKILAKASGEKKVEPGQIVEASIDLAMAHDLTATLAIEAFQQVGAKRVWDPDRIVIIFDHNAPASSVESAELHKDIRKFVKEQGIKNFYDVGNGICHQILLESHAKPGQLIVGADSHSVTYGALGAFSTGIGSTEMGAVFTTGKLWFKVPETIKVNIRGELQEFVTPKDVILDLIGTIGMDGATYKAMLFSGPVAKGMSVDGRATLCNMSVEAGAKVGMVEPDEKVESYVGKRTSELRFVRSDPDAFYDVELDLDVSDLDPQVACPPSVSDVKPVSEVEGVPADQFFIGSCTNGRLEDLRVAARVLRGKKVKEGVRLIIIPASKRVYADSLKEGLIEEFLRAGAVVCNPCCGPCIGLSLGLLAADEVCISSANRNFVSRMGHPKSRIYLASPATVAASAVIGELTDPRELRT